MTARPDPPLHVADALADAPADAPADASAGAVTPGAERDDEQVLRFDVHARLQHWLLVALVVALALTGLPQKFADSDWARDLVQRLGGLTTARALHRAAGYALLALAVEHGVVATWQLVEHAASDMLLTRKDFTDAIEYLGYCMGVRATPPRMDRYDYRQKFEYWALVLGGGVMIVSGLVLCFPQRVAAWLPGQVIAAAKVAHSNEAMLALLTVVVWHMYGAHLNPDVFPIDKVMFTGRISRGRMRREHPLEYERRFGAAPPAPPASPAPPPVGQDDPP